MSRSLFYGRPRLGANKFPNYSTLELLRDLESPSLDDATRAAIEAEVARRRVAAANRVVAARRWKREG